MDGDMMNKNVKAASGVNIAAGVWLVAAPFVLGFADVTDGLWNHVIVGLAVLILAGIRVSNPGHNSWISWVNVVLGVWMVASPFVMGLTGTILWNSIIVGALVAVMGVWSASASQSTRRPHAHA